MPSSRCHCPCWRVCSFQFLVKRLLFYWSRRLIVVCILCSMPNICFQCRETCTQQKRKELLQETDKIVDDLYYFKDIIKVGEFRLSRLVTENLLSLIVFPLLQFRQSNVRHSSSCLFFFSLLSSWETIVCNVGVMFLWTFYNFFFLFSMSSSVLYYCICGLLVFISLELEAVVNYLYTDLIIYHIHFVWGAGFLKTLYFTITRFLWYGLSLIFIHTWTWKLSSSMSKVAPKVATWVNWLTFITLNNYRYLHIKSTFG